jgi:hypothetical protein
LAPAVLALTLALASGPVPSWHAAAQNAERKLHAIEGGRVGRGETVTFTTSEVNAFLLSRIPVYAPGAIRDPRVWFAVASGSASAVVDFLKLERETGSEPNWMIAKLMEGERPIEVSAHLKSSGGWAAVYLDRVAISGVSVSGSPLDMLISTFVKPLFPEAKVNEPFELGYGIEQLEIRPEGLRVRLRR